jgi:hypothetical protein
MNIKRQEKKTGFLPTRSDSFPYDGENAQEVSMYALAEV